MTSFPDHIFDGTHPQRPTLSTVSAPEFADYKVLVRELRATQEYMLHLSKDLGLVPDLDTLLQEANEKLLSLKKEVIKVTPPEILSVEIKTLKTNLDLIDSRKQVAILQGEILALREAMTKNQLQVLKLQETFAQDVKGFQNTLFNKFQKLEKDATKRLEDLETKVTQIHTQAEIGNLLTRLEKMK